jgi:hypothetical protein|tara:strand:- start:672 stop:1196 length:525 start_codon:yes stop_codon:yes gene_type:complete
MESYFSGIWKDDYVSLLKHSGDALIDYVNKLSPSSVLDVGCGYNRLRDAIPGLVGIDPYNSEAHLHMSLEEYYQYEFPPADTVLCLGSINFGSEKNIDEQISMLDKLFLKDCIFRVNPGIEHSWSNEWKDIEWYDWNIEKINKIAIEYRYKIKSLEEEYTSQGHKRYFFHYAKY